MLRIAAEILYVPARAYSRHHHRREQLAVRAVCPARRRPARRPLQRKRVAKLSITHNSAAQFKVKVDVQLVESTRTRSPRSLGVGLSLAPGSPGPGIREFAALLDRFLDDLPIRPLFIGNVFDRTLGDDGRNVLGIDPAQARCALDRMNNAIASVATHHGTLVDLYAHFLTGEESRFTRTIEPSLIGASEVRRCFLDKILGNPI